MTLIGPGGVGKSRLALQVATDVRSDFVGGAWLAELAAVTDPMAVPHAIASVIGLRQREGRTITETLVEFLTARDSLVILDNCEHLVDAAADVAAAIVRSCAGTRVLATSRESLAVAGEQLVPLRPLGSPIERVSLDEARRFGAVALFADRARSADPDFALIDDNAESVIQLCRRLDGLPLAIELAAARVGALSPVDMLARLDQRFRLLSGGGRAQQERHQTLRRTVDWSYELLDQRDRVVFNRLSVFAGSFDVSAAEAIVASDTLDSFDVVDALVSLVAKPMLIVEQTSDGRRYRLLETLRQYGRDKLADAEETFAVRRRHAEYFVAWAAEADQGLLTTAEPAWHRRIMSSFDDLRQVIELAVDEHDTDLAMRLGAALEYFSVTRFTSGVNEWYRQITAMPGSQEHEEAARVFATAALCRFGVGDDDAAEFNRLAAAGLQMARRSGVAVTGSVYNAAAVSALIAGDFDEMLAHWRTAVELSDAGSDIAWKALHLANLTYGLIITAHTKSAAEMSERAVRHARSSGSPSLLSWALAMHAHALFASDPYRAIELLDEAVESDAGTGSDWFSAYGLNTLAPRMYEAGMVEGVLRCGARFLERQLRIGFRQGSHMIVGLLGVIALDRGDIELARECFSYIDELPWEPTIDHARAEFMSGKPRAEISITELADFGLRTCERLDQLVHRLE